MRHRIASLASLLLVSTSLVLGQAGQWQSMDGPYVNETRYHARLSTGERTFVGSLSGTFRSIDNGASWTRVAPATSTVQALYKGTGDVLYTTGTIPNTGRQNQGIVYGAFRSTDKGATWVDIGSGYNLRLLPGRGDTLYRTIGRTDIVLGAMTISVSTDRGNSWVTVAEPIYSGPATGYSSLYLQQGELYSLMTNGAFPDATARSRDGGKTWQLILGSYIIYSPPGHLLAHRREWGSYQPLPSANLDYSSDNGTTWNTVLHADSSFSSIIDNGQGTILVLSQPGGIVKRSTNKGATWVTLNAGMPGEGLRSIAFLGLTKIIGIGKEGHIFRSLDFGTSWQEVVDNAHSLPLRSLQPSIDSILVAADFRGDWIESSDAGSSWTERSLRYDLQKMTSIATLPSGSIVAGSMLSLHWKRAGMPWSSGTGAGPVWTIGYDGHQHIYTGSGRHASDGLTFNGSLNRIDTAGATVKYIAGGSLTYYYSYPDWYSVVPMSHDRIVTGWATRIATYSDTSYDVRISSPAGTGNFSALLRGPSSVLFAGNTGSGVYRSSDSGATWTQVNSGLTDQSINSLARDSAGQIYAGASQGVFRSSDDGASWTSISNGLPAAAIQALAISGAGHMYAGTPAGIYINTGTVWKRWSDGLTVQDVPALAIDRDQNILAATWGAGIYSRPAFSIPAPMHFTTVQTSPVLSDASLARATVWGDYDGDGDPDLFIANAGGTNNQLYRYDGWPTGFTKVTVGTIVNDGGDSRDAAWGDYDNDGHVDMLVVNYDVSPFLYHNNGNGSFTKVTAGSIVADAAACTGAAWADYDNDGLLDLFITRTGNQNNSLFHNNGGGSFTKVLAGDPVIDGGNSEGCSWGDYDNDGYVDLYVANAGQTGFLYHNNGNGTFTRIHTTATTSVTGQARSCGWVDINNDGQLDLWISNGDRAPLLLYRNDGNAQFTEILGGYVWTDATTSRPVAWGDFDNDGDLDIFIAGRKAISVAYINDGTGQFTRVAAGMPMVGLDLDGPVSWVDYSGDGNLDLLVANTVGPRQLYWSDGIGRSALRVRCAGTLSDSRGVGARVAIKATIGGKTSWYYRTATGRDDLSMHFGLGDATTVDSVVVRWPIAGVQVLAPVDVDANLVVTEPAIRNLPLLVYPPHRSVDIPTTTTLRWRSIAGATAYHLQVSTDSLFSSFEYNDSTTVDTTKNLGPFAQSANFFWRVRAKGSFITTPWTDTWRFTTVMPIPDSPVLASPAQGAGHQWISGFLSWRVNSRASRYHIQMATDSLYAVLLINDSTLADTSRAYSGAFDSRYYWHVRAINGSGSSAFSSSRAFNTVLPPPLAPVLKGPALNSNIESQTAMLTWIKPARGEQYQLQVAYDSLLTTRFLNDSALTDTMRSISVTPGKSYSWRVRASGEGGFGPYSTIWSFNSILATPVQITPLNNATNLPRSLTIKWHPVAGAETYRLQVSTDSTFAGSLLLDDSIHVDTTAALPTLGEHIQYFWRVRAQTESVSGVYSPAWRFRTALGIPGLAQPADKALNLPISVSLTWHPVGNATGYHLQMATSASLDSGIVVNDSLIVDTTRVMSGLLYNTQYYWRVKGRTLSGSGEFSPAWWFRTVQVQPSKPELSHPLSNSALNTNVIAFVWRKATPDVVRYWHELSTDSIFFIKTMDSTLTDTTYLRTGIPNGTYWWRVRANNSAGWGAFSDVRKFSVTVTGIDDARDIPTVYSLDQNYPNPFNPTTIIRFGLPAASHVSLIVYNTLGQEVKRFLDEPLEAGYHVMQFDGARLSSGVYFYRLMAGNFVETKRFLLIK